MDTVRSGIVPSLPTALCSILLPWPRLHCFAVGTATAGMGVTGGLPPPLGLCKEVGDQHPLGLPHGPGSLCQVLVQ